MKIENIYCSHDNEEVLDQLQPLEGNMWETGEQIDIYLDMWRDDDVVGKDPTKLKISVLKALKTDLASDPGNILKRVGTDERDFAISWIVHDSLNAYNVAQVAGRRMWETTRLTRKEVDFILREMLRWQGMDRDLSHFVYKVLRNWGWVAWLRWRLFNLFKKGRS